MPRASAGRPRGSVEGRRLLLAAGSPPCSAWRSGCARGAPRSSLGRAGGAGGAGAVALVAVPAFAIVLSLANAPVDGMDLTHATSRAAMRAGLLLAGSPRGGAARGDRRGDDDRHDRGLRRAALRRRCRRALVRLATSARRSRRLRASRAPSSRWPCRRSCSSPPCSRRASGGSRSPCSRRSHERRPDEPAARSPCDVAKDCHEDRDVAARRRQRHPAIAAGALLFGAAVGSWRGGAADRFAALKLPLVTLGTLVLCVPAFYAIAAVFGRPWPLRAAISIMLARARASRSSCSRRRRSCGSSMNLGASYDAVKLSPRSPTRSRGWRRSASPARARRRDRGGWRRCSRSSASSSSSAGRWRGSSARTSGRRAARTSRSSRASTRAARLPALR